MEKRGTHRHGMIAKKFPENSTAVPPLLGPFLEIGIAAGCLWRGESPSKIEVMAGFQACIFFTTKQVVSL